MSYKKFGRLHFVRFGRFGFSFFISRKRKQLTPAQQQRALSRAANLDRLSTNWCIPRCAHPDIAFLVCQQNGRHSLWVDRFDDGVRRRVRKP